jgi:hypothetical protein
MMSRWFMHNSIVDELTRRMEELGAPDPAGRAASEAREDIPQQARYLFLRAIWPQNIEPYGTEQIIRRFPAGARLLEAGASLDDLSTLLRAIAYEVAFGLVDRIDDGHDHDAPDDSPGWRLVETVGQDAITGRVVAGLHEDLLTLDPSGHDGADLWE